MNTEHHILCLAARTRLTPVVEQQLIDLFQTPVDWEYLWAQAHLHDVLPLLATNLSRLEDRITPPAGWMARARRRLYATLLSNTTLADELVRVCGALATAGIAALPVKGVVLAETLYGSLGLRPAADLDVLVRPSDLPAARVVLRELGFAHKEVPSFAELHHMFHDPQYFRRHATGELCLELHWALWPARYFGATPDLLWERAVIAHIQGTPQHILSPEDTLLHLAIHRSRSPLRLRFICDIAELLHKQGSILDWKYLLAQSRLVGARTAMFSALTLAQQLLDAPIPPTLLRQFGINRIKQRLLETTCGARALFRPAAVNDLEQQPHLTLRVLEQDGTGQIIRSLSYSLMRTVWKHLYHLRRLLRPPITTSNK